MVSLEPIKKRTEFGFNGPEASWTSVGKENRDQSYALIVQQVYDRVLPDIFF